MFSKNKSFFVCAIFGFLVSYYFPENSDKEIISHCPETQKIKLARSSDDSSNDFFEPQLNLNSKPNFAKKQMKTNFVRPRYFSTELGIREKLFIGVLTSQQNIESLATAFNKTAAHLTNRIKYFMAASNIKTNFKLKNIVGFTDNREKMFIFHVFKYIAGELDEFIK